MDDQTNVQRAALSEPVEVPKFWRNRRGEAVVVQLREFEGRAIVDACVNFTDREGRLKPIKKGLSLAARCLPELAKAFVIAELTTRQPGLTRHGWRP